MAGDNDDPPPGLLPDGTLAECSEDYDDGDDLPEEEPEPEKTADRRWPPRIIIHRR